MYIEAFTTHVGELSDTRQSAGEQSVLAMAKAQNARMSMSFRQQPRKSPELTYRYHIRSASLSEKQLAEVVRSHWAVENSLHWILSVSMGEDDCQIHQNHGA